MIKIVIVEDEKPACERLVRLLSKYTKPTQIVKTLDSVAESIQYFNSHNDFDLILMDIQLGDGLSLDIFHNISLKKPIIFITAYDDYVLKAFKTNSIDYLLKPIEQDELFSALDKYQQVKSDYASDNGIQNLLNLVNQGKYKTRFLVKKGNQLLVLNTSDIAYFYFEDGYTHAKTYTSQIHLIDPSIEQLYSELDPKTFFKVNRKMIVHIDSIISIESYFNARYSLKLNPPFTEQVIVSRERARDFKEWLQA